MTVQDRVQELLEPIVATVGVELVDVEFTGGTLRLTVDQDDGITTEALTKVNRLVSPILDQHDPIPGRYTLEVSSPGLERPLKRPAQFRRAIGEDIVLKLVPETTPRRIKGRLAAVVATDAEPSSADASGPELAAELVVEASEIDGVALDEPEERRVPTGDVATARTVFDWGPSPKPGGPKSKGKKSAKKAANPSSKKKPDSEKSGSE